MAKFHFERGKPFKCPVEIFQFIYSDWQAADKVTGCHWNVEKNGSKFRGSQSRYWGEFDLVHHEYDTQAKKGTFTYIVTLGGILIKGNGKLEIKYGADEQGFAFGEGNVDLKIQGLLSLFSWLFDSKLHDLTDMLVDYQQRACNKIAEDPEGIMHLLSEDQQNELRKRLKTSFKKNIFEASLQIIPKNGKCTLSFETPNQVVEEDVEVKETFEGLLGNFNALIEDANRYSDTSRSPGSRGIKMDTRSHFYVEVKALGNNLFKNYISGEIAGWLKSTFSYKSESKIRVRIEARGYSSKLPWELIYDGNDFLCIKSATFRAERGGIKKSKRNLDIKGVLIIASDPDKDLENVVKEAEIISDSIRKVSEVKIGFLSGRDATKENVMKEIESGRYQVIHFSGHSEFKDTSPGSSFLLMQDGRHLIADELARLSIENDLRLIFLNSCSSGASNIGLYDTAGLASAFVKTGVPYVIGMKWKITDIGARLLSEEFYKEYIFTNDPIESLRKARKSVGNKTDWEDPAWAAPVIYAT